MKNKKKVIKNLRKTLDSIGLEGYDVAYYAIKDAIEYIKNTDVQKKPETVREHKV